LVRISIQVVSPPYLRYSLPETEMEPLAPQHRINIAFTFCFCLCQTEILFPEDTKAGIDNGGIIKDPFVRSDLLQSLLQTR
jgi:hypothetical protein